MDLREARVLEGWPSVCSEVASTSAFMLAFAGYCHPEGAATQVPYGYPLLNPALIVKMCGDEAVW
jgi:hypothetical protein